MRRAAITTIALALVASLALAAPVFAKPKCSSRAYAKAVPKKDRNVVIAPGLSYPRPYNVGIASYAYACSGKTIKLRHIVNFSTKALPRGWKFIFSVATRKAKGRRGGWVSVKRGKAFIFEFEGRQTVQEFVLYQRRSYLIGGPVAAVRVRHSGAASPSTGAFPNGSTLYGYYRAYSGFPEAKPGPG